MFYLLILLSALLFFEVRSLSEDHECSALISASNGSAFNSLPLELGEKFTWEYPLLDINRGEIGTWQGYCVGLGIKDPNYDQICHHVYTINDPSGSGVFTGIHRYNTNDQVMMVAITGATGFLFGATGDINITYAEGSYLHDTMICYD